MRYLSKLLITSSLLAAPAITQAQESYVDLRVEPGIAIPVGTPQQDRFGLGGSIAVKPEISIFDIFSFGPSVSVTAFDSKIEGISTPAFWTLGSFIRIKRPHGFAWNKSEGVALVSPWTDGEIQYVRTGALDRLGYAAAIGAAWAVDANRMLWIGPYLKYEGIHQDGGEIGMNTNDSHSLIFGASFEVGEPMKKPIKEEPCPEKPVKPEAPKPAPLPQPEQPKFQDVNMELSQVVQFAWDSDVLDNVATQQLDSVIKKISEAKEVKSIKVEGHASSEGQVVHNDKLAQQRANSVMNYLAAHGVSRDKLSAVGFGSHVPVADNKTETGRVQNRRAQFVVNFVIVKEVQK